MLPLHVVTVGGRPVVALSDSGSNVNLVAEQVVDSLGLRAHVDCSHIVEWEGTTGGSTAALGSITLHVTPPSETGISAAIPIICFVAPSLPGGVGLLLRCPASSPAPTPFWRWRLGESRRAGLLSYPAQVPRHRRARSALMLLALSLAAVTTASALYPTPTPAAWQRYLAGDFELEREDEGDNVPTVGERVADAVADAGAPIDFATVELQLTPDTNPAEEAALRSLLSARSAAFELQPGGIDCTPVRLPIRSGAAPRRASQLPRSVRDPVRLAAMKECLEKHLALGIIRPCNDADGNDFAGQLSW